MKKSAALVYVKDNNIKKRLISVMARNKMNFYETENSQDLVYKMKLLKDVLDIVIIDTDEQWLEDIFDDVKEITNTYPEIKVLTLLHKYKASYIDLALRSKVNDLMIMPFNDDDFLKKIRSLIKSREHCEILPEGYMEQINTEIGRATRGGYDVSFVMVEIPKVHKEEARLFEKGLMESLRITDSIIKWDIKRYLVVCPFTKKELIQVVEKKIREAYQKITVIQKMQDGFYLYGVTYPQDGKEFSDIYTKLCDGLHDSIVINNMKKPIKNMSREELNQYVKKLSINNICN